MQTVSQKPKRKRARVAAPRKEIDPLTTDLRERFALHLRTLLDKKGMGPKAFCDGMKEAGDEVSLAAVKKWMAGNGFPNVANLVSIAKVLGVADYRKILPPLD